MVYVEWHAHKTWLLELDVWNLLWNLCVSIQIINHILQREKSRKGVTVNCSELISRNKIIIKICCYYVGNDCFSCEKVWFIKLLLCYSYIFITLIYLIEIFATWDILILFDMMNCYVSWQISDESIPSHSTYINFPVPCRKFVLPFQFFSLWVLCSLVYFCLFVFLSSFLIHFYVLNEKFEINGNMNNWNAVEVGAGNWSMK